MKVTSYECEVILPSDTERILEKLRTYLTSGEGLDNCCFILPDGERLSSKPRLNADGHPAYSSWQARTHDDAAAGLGLYLTNILAAGVARAIHWDIEMAEGMMTDALARAIIDNWILRRHTNASHSHAIVEVRDPKGQHRIRSKSFDVDKSTADSLRHWVNGG